jgi:hypothetical protein
LAFRDVTNRTNRRTVVAALVPPNTILTNKAPYFLWPRGGPRDQAYLLGVLCSMPLDWYARRVVEISLNFHILNGFPVPAPRDDDPKRRRIEAISGVLAAVDERFATWATDVGVPVGSAVDREELVAELDALVARLYGLDERQVRHIFETFHPTWDYTVRLARVLTYFEEWASAA